MIRKQQRTQLILISIGLLLILLTYLYYPYINKAKLQNEQIVEKDSEETLNKAQSSFENLEYEGIKFKQIVEKPTHKYLVNAGLYIINPSIIDLLENGINLDMPDLISKLNNNNKNIIVYPIHEYWLDIGRADSLERAYMDWH